MEDSHNMNFNEGSGSITPLMCPNCGSSSLQVQSDDTFLCLSCDTVFKHSVPNNSTVYVTNEYHLSPGGTTKDVYTFQPKCGKTDFARNALIQLASMHATPEDVMDGEFSPVVSDVRQYIEVEAKYTVSWSATIGHDRQEKYMTTERVRDKYTGQYSNQLVEKTRTVTDWIPQTGVFYDTDKNIYALSGDAKESSRFWEFLRHNRSAVVHSGAGMSVPASPATVTAADIAAANKLGNSFAEEKCRKQLPGDKQKDFHASVVSETISTAQYVVREFSMPYVCRGTPYTLYGYDGGDTVVMSSFPNALKEIEAEVSEKTKGSLALSLLAGAACVILCLVGTFVTLPNPLIWLAPTVPLFVLTLGINIIHYMRRNKKEQDISKRSAERKMSKLDELLSDLKLKPLTEQERQTILSNHHVK